MSQSFDLLMDGIIETMRSRILPHLADDSVRGQAYGVIFALSGLKLSADWAIAPLRSQVALQDQAFAEFARLAAGMDPPPHPVGPRAPSQMPDSAELERLRNDGDHKLGELLMWSSGPAAAADPDRAKAIEARLRHFMREQLKVDISTMATPMFHELATGSEPAGES